VDANETILEKVDAKRRGFVKKVIVGTAFAAPVVSSFSMDGLSIKIGRSAFAGNVSFSVITMN